MLYSTQEIIEDLISKHPEKGSLQLFIISDAFNEQTEPVIYTLGDALQQIKNKEGFIYNCFLVRSFFNTVVSSINNNSFSTFTVKAVFKETLKSYYNEWVKSNNKEDFMPFYSMRIKQIFEDFLETLPRQIAPFFETIGATVYSCPILDIL